MSGRQGGFEGEVGLSPGVELQKSGCGLPACGAICLQAPAPLASLSTKRVCGTGDVCMRACVCCGMQALRVGVQNSRQREYPGTCMVSRALTGSEATGQGGPWLAWIQSA